MSDSINSLRDGPLLGHVQFGDYESTAENFALIERRNRHFAGSFLFYHDPVHIVRGDGAHLYDQHGHRFIDCYNNVQSMGHANPAITRAISEQSALLNTHTRYLHENVIDLAEEVAATLPGDLDVCMFVCTGTEACELAMRIARVVTGRSGALVMENSYHGNSKLVGEMSTATYAPEQCPPWIATAEPPNSYRGSYRREEYSEQALGEKYAALVEPAIATLEESGEGLAAFVCDTIFDSQGALEAPPNYFQEVYQRVRSAGGVCIADEVQAGVCRTGKFWGFEHYDVVPDIVFTGKPFGGGYPIAAVFTTREIACAWAERDIYFNTFGGNPVAAATALAVIRYAREQDILARVEDVGGYLRARLENLAERHEMIGDIQGKGLFIGVELVTDRDSRKPANEVASRIPDALKEQGVLIGLSGPYGNRLKFRPPLVFSREDVDVTVDTFDRVLREIGDPSRRE